MNRRDSFSALLALGAMLTPLPGAARPATAARPHRIGLIPNLPPRRHEQIRVALGELGWSPGTDYTLFQGGPEQGDDIELAVKRVVDEEPDLILAAITSYALAAHRLTKTIPIVMWTSGFPVEAGLARSHARPGMNVTGMSIYSGTGIFGKLLQLLLEAAPRIRRVGVLWTYVPPFHPKEEIEPAYRELREAAAALGLGLRILEITRAEQTRSALAFVEAEKIEALLLTSGAPPFPHRREVTAFAVGRRLPTISDWEWPSIEPQPLMRYSPPPMSLLRQAASYVDRILRGGVSPGELPIQRPAKFELEVNMRTAKALELSVPSSIQLRADRVIE
jgi:putative ABC transport system substrate-binding protein